MHHNALESIIGNYQVLNHSDNFSGSIWSYKLSGLLFLALHILALSAYNRTDDERELGRSFTYRRTAMAQKLHLGALQKEQFLS